MKRSKKRRLKMTAQYVDFLGVEIFNFITNPLLIDVANKLKVDEKKFYSTFYEGFKCYDPSVRHWLSVSLTMCL